jgi:polysaccharide export outer membrane protein
MRLAVGFARLAVTSLLEASLCVAVVAQDGQNNRTLGSNKNSSSTSQTGAGPGGAETTVAKAGEAGGAGDPQLGGERRPLYRLTRSDVVSISFTLSPEFDQTLTVQPDGYVALKDAGMVSAQGLTLEEFRAAVQHAYQGYLHDPQVAVALKDFEHPYFIAGGEVGRPGKYELRGETTVAEAVQIAGGFTQQAKHSQVLLFRRVNDSLVEARILNLKKMLAEKNLGENPQLRPGDLVFVPQNAISKIAKYISRPSMSMYVSSAQF